MKTFAEYELEAVRTVNPSLDDRDRLMDAAVGLAEESGEVLGSLRKHAYAGEQLDVERLRLELGDALWCLAMTARAAGLSLEEVAGANIAKLRDRYPAGFTGRATP